MIKTFIFDIDGTLFTNESKILKESKKAIESLVKMGHQYILASGRPIDSLKQIAASLPEKPVFLIGSNGATSYDFKNKKIYHKKTINKAFVDQLLMLEDLQKERIIFQKPEKSFAFNFGEKGKNNFKKFSFGKMDEIMLEDIKKLDNISMLGLILWKKTKAWSLYKNKIMNLAKEFKLDVIDMPEYDVINIFPGDTSKGSALTWLSINGLINRKNCYAFGDQLNDIEMFKFAKNSYAMGQSPETVKTNAMFTIGPNNEPSIANKISKILNLD